MTDLLIVGGGPAGDDGRAAVRPRRGATSGCSKSTPTSSAISAATPSIPRPWKSSTSWGCSNDSSKRPHDRLDSARIRVAGKEYTIGDLSHLDTPAPFIAMMPQWEFLDFLRDEAAAFPTSGWKWRHRRRASSRKAGGSSVSG